MGIGAALLAACAIPAKRTAPVAPAEADSHIEAIPKGEGPYRLLGNGRVRVDARGEFVLDHEDATKLYVRIYTPRDKGPNVALPEADAAPPPLTLADRRRLQATSIGDGLPRGGQWRDQFAVADVLGAGTPQIVFAPPRKTGGTPLAFRFGEDRWERVVLPVPDGHYDYGGIAVGDLDGDGHADVLLGMHLTGFSALLGRAEGGYRRVDAGLPQRASADFAGTGHAVLVLPAARGKAAPFVLLQEPGARTPASRDAPGLAVYRSTDRGVVAAPLGNADTRGKALAFVAAQGACPAKLAVVLDSNQPPQLWQSTDLQHFAPRRLEPYPAAYGFVGAVALSESGSSGCGTLAVAYQNRVGHAWRAQLDVYRDDGRAWQRVALLDLPKGAPIGALRFVPGTNGVERLAALDDVGTLRLIDLDPSGPVLALESPAPAWRKGCAGSDLHVLPGESPPSFRLVAAFAGEPGMGEFDRCTGGGGLEAWRIAPRAVAR